VKGEGKRKEMTHEEKDNTREREKE